ncbi:MAG: DUF362 domain-containing protein [Thermodesulfobacteriota bacterium]
MENFFPKVALVRQQLISAAIPDASLETGKELAGLERDLPSLAGKTVGLGVGSRKIDRIGQVVAAATRFLREKGAVPFLVPAMGSHGGATPEGQAKVLEGLGVTSLCPDVPLLCGMETDPIADLPSGETVLFSRDALGLDFLVPVNRVKPHTKFTAEIESGLCKMLVVGFGKAEGAASFHRAAVRRGFSLVEAAAAAILSRVPVLFGLALLEDGEGKLSRVEAVPARDIIAREKELLPVAYGNLGRLPFAKLDVLIVDAMGKDISGIGMDSKVTGRHRDISGDFRLPPDPGRIFVRELSPGSAGNANGVGLADFVTSRLAAAVDRKKTYVNSLSALSPEKAAIPMHFDTDRECLEACLSTCGCEKPESARLAWIPSTSRLSLLAASPALEPEIRANPRLCRISDYRDLAFGPDGNLAPWIIPAESA